MNKITKTGIICLFALAGALAAKAADVTWYGYYSSDWNDVGDNWDVSPDGNNANVNNGITNETNGVAYYPIMTNDQVFVAGDVKIGEWWGTGRFDQTAGMATNGNLVLGWVYGTGYYNLADTTTNLTNNLTSFGQGSGTMDLTGAFILGSFFAADGGTEVVNINTTGGMNVNGMMYVGKGNGTATLNMDSGTVICSNNLPASWAGGQIWVGFNGDTNENYPATGSLTLGGGLMDAQYRINVGSIDTGNVNSSGNLNSNNVGVLTINNGTVQADGVNYWEAGVRIGANGGTGTVNLNGGTLQCRYVYSEGSPGSNGVSIFNFNGGTLKPTQSLTLPWDVFFGGWPGNYGTDYRYLTSAYVQTGGAIIDTAGYYVIFSQPLLTGTNITDGGLTKNGAGTMEFDGNGSTFTGPVMVNAGTLYCNPGNRANNNDFSYCSGVIVNSNATLETTANGLFGWDGSQAKPITVNAGGVATVDANNDCNVGIVILNGGTLAGGPNNSGWGSWSFGRAAVNKLVATDNSTVTATNLALFGGTYIDVAASKTLTISGTIDDSNYGVSGSVIKSGGAGTLVLSGANTYTGNTTINAGTLELAQSIAALATNSTVTIASGAQLQLDNATVTNVVNSLVLNGTAESPGTYGSANSSGYISGSGHLLVLTGPSVGPSVPAHLTNSFSGGVLTLTWPAGQSWRLVSQTNSLSTGLSSTGWNTVSGVSDGSATITVDHTKPTVFYKLVYP